MASIRRLPVITTMSIKLRGYEFFSAMGSPKRIVAPMVCGCVYIVQLSILKSVCR